jgi:hypothetical protein
MQNILLIRIKVRPDYSVPLYENHVLSGRKGVGRGVPQQVSELARLRSTAGEDVWQHPSQPRLSCFVVKFISWVLESIFFVLKKDFVKVLILSPGADTGFVRVLSA